MFTSRGIEVHQLSGVGASTLQDPWVQSHPLLEAIPVAIFTTDADGRLTYYNEAAAQLWGNRPRLGEARWTGAWKLYAADGSPMNPDDSPMALALREKREVRGVEVICERPDGTRIALIPYPTPLYDAAGNMVGAVNVLVDISERKTLEERLELYAREVGHRAQNLLASVTAILRLTKAADIKSFVEKVCGRINAFGQVHHLIGGNVHGRVGLRAVAEKTLAAYAGEDQGAGVVLDGPNLSLTLDESQGVAMILHELATNSVKYGALSAEGGQVRVAWSLGRDNRVRLVWRELGGPMIEPPAASGFGTRLIAATANDKLKGNATFDWRCDGLVCEITGTLTEPLERSDGRQADSPREEGGRSAVA